MFSVKNKHIIVTGASGVIGSTISVSLAKDGAKLTILGRSAEKLQVTEELIKTYTNDYLAFTCDVMDVAALEEINKEVLARFSRIDGLINVAGGVSKGAATKTEFMTPNTPPRRFVFWHRPIRFPVYNGFEFYGKCDPIQSFW